MLFVFYCSRCVLVFWSKLFVFRRVQLFSYAWLCFTVLRVVYSYVVFVFEGVQLLSDPFFSQHVTCASMCWAVFWNTLETCFYCDFVLVCNSCFAVVAVLWYTPPVLICGWAMIQVMSTGPSWPDVLCHNTSVSVGPSWPGVLCHNTSVSVGPSWPGVLCHDTGCVYWSLIARCSVS